MPLLGGTSRTRYVHAFYFVLDHICEHFTRCIDDISRWTSSAETFADAIHAAGAPAPRCIGFLDGTFRPCPKPKRHQRQVYSGYKKAHGLKYQAVMGPNGLILDLYSCVVGRRSDSYMLTRSQLLQRMDKLCADANAIFYLYADPAYPTHLRLLRGYKGAMTAAQRAFVSEMNPLRTSVEWGFAIVLNDWSYVDYKKNGKLQLQPISKFYVAACLLSNMKTCVTAEHALDGKGNQVAVKFNVAPPTLHDYLWGP